MPIDLPIENSPHRRLRWLVKAKSSPSFSFWILILLSIVAALPFWTVTYPVMADYPNHLARWFVLFHIKDAGYQFTRLYAPAWQPLPYIFPDVLAVALQFVLPIAVVGKLVLTIGVFLVTLGSYYFVEQACPENTAVAIFSVLVALNPNFLMGSISYEYSIGFCLIAVGLWIGYCNRPRATTAFGVLAYLVLAYLSHLVGFFVAGLAMGVYALFQPNRWRKTATLALLSLPALILLALHPVRGAGNVSIMYAGLTPWSKLKYLLWPLRMYQSKILDLLSLLALAFLLAYVLLKEKMLAVQPVWAAVGASVLLVYFASPAQFGLAGAFMDVRFTAFVCLFLLAAVRFARIPRVLFVGLALVVLFRIATVQQLFLSQQRELKQLTASFEAIPRNATVVPAVPLPDGTVMGKGYVHHLEYGVIDRGFLDPVLFHLPGIQPIRLAGSPYCPNIYCDPANATYVNWQQLARSYDYLWVRDDPAVAAVSARLGDVIFSNGGVTIYRIRHP